MSDRQKILIVDDKKENLVTLRHVLSTVDADVIEATSGNQALAATFDHQFAVAVLDVQMPGMSGYELAEHLRGDEKTRLIPILFLTAHLADELEIFKGYQSGGVDYLTKPYSPEVLRGKLDIFLEIDRRKRESIMHQNQLESLVAGRTRELEHELARRKQIEDELKSANKLLDDVQSLAKMGGWKCNIATGRHTWTDEVYRIYGVEKDFNPSDVNRCISYYAPEYIPVITDAFEQSVSHGKPFDVEVQFVRQNGERIWARATGNPLVINGKVEEVTGFFTDITARKSDEQEKHSLGLQLQHAQKLESIGVLAGGIAHDFNNILAVIICNCDLATQRPQMAGELIPEIEEAAQRAAELCHQMLAYAGKSMTIRKEFNISALVDDTLKMLNATLNQNVVIKTNRSGDIPRITGDTSQIRQIVMNLIINASEAIGEAHGEICVSLINTEIIAGQTEKDHLGKIIPPGQYVCLEVTDTGCGMDDETKERIFEPFYTTKFTGRGLGMSATLGIITSHKGALQLFSQPDHGSTFKVYLPTKSSDSSVEPLQQTDSLTWQGSGSILLVEDEPQLMLVAKNLLKALGFSVFEASNGSEALELYRKNSEYINLVVTDLGMPVMNGYELLREIKQINPELPIIISSGFGDVDINSHITDGEVAGFLSKPYSFAQMRELLKSVMERGNPDFT